jgi:hypothetical protein
VTASWFRAFLLTQVVEMGVYVHAPGRERPWPERVAIAFGASAITHPLVWFVIPEVMAELVQTGDLRVDWWITVAFAEHFAVIAEAFWLAAFGVRWRWAFAVALFANGWSFTLGLFCYRLLSWTG